MKDTEAEKHALLVLERYNEQKEQQKKALLKDPNRKKENIFKTVMHQVFTEMSLDPRFLMDEATFFREVGKQCHILQPKKSKKPEETTFKKVKRRIAQTVNQISEEFTLAKKREDDIVNWEHDRGVSDETLADLGHRVYPAND